MFWLFLVLVLVLQGLHVHDLGCGVWHLPRGVEGPQGHGEQYHMGAGWLGGCHCQVRRGLGW